MGYLSGHRICVRCGKHPSVTHTGTLCAGCLLRSYVQRNIRGARTKARMKAARQMQKEDEKKTQNIGD